MSIVTREWTNWAGNQSILGRGVAYPRSTDEVAEVVRAARAAGQRVKAVGAGHSFSDIALAPDIRVDMSAMSSPVAVDSGARLATVQAGMSLRALNATLAVHGLALPNLGDMAEQTVAGALSTGTHGTGVRYGGLATWSGADAP